MHSSIQKLTDFGHIGSYMTSSNKYGVDLYSLTQQEQCIVEYLIITDPLFCRAINNSILSVGQALHIEVLCYEYV